MKKILSVLIAVLLVVGMTSTALADETAANTLEQYNGVISEYTDAVIAGGGMFGNLDGGKVIRGGGEADADFHANANSGGSGTTIGANTAEAVDNWVGLKFDTPVVPTRFVFSTVTAESTIEGSYIQASNDGINWETLITAPALEVGAWQGYGEDTKFCVETDKAYTYFRYVNIGGSDYFDVFWVYGDFAEVVTNTLDTYNGEISEYTDTKMPANDFFGYMGEATVIRGGGEADADFYANANGGGSGGYIGTNTAEAVDNWVGLKFDTPVVPTKFVYSSIGASEAIEGSYIQASNDGINWETLITVPALEVEQWHGFGEDTKFDITTENAYTYFRYVNIGGSDYFDAFWIYGDFVSTGDVDAGDVDAGDVDTGDVDTGATDDEENAPATFDVAVIAAVVAVVSAAGYAIARKRK